MILMVLWICDFRALNKCTKKRATPIGDTFAKARALAARKLKSTLDALHGFNQMENTERAKRLLQIITSRGLKQWEVMPYGVCNGPPYFQEFMLNLFGGSLSSGRPSLLDTAMDDLEGYLDVFIDDLQLGTGNVVNASPWGQDPTEEDFQKEFERHLEALRRVFNRAREGQVRFKLSKCYFCQFTVECLGMIAGCGVLKADPKKTAAISVWPRPSRMEDLERFLATTVYIRQHLSPRYSEVSNLCVMPWPSSTRSGNTG